jgi:hypothetical protein
MMNPSRTPINLKCSAPIDSKEFMFRRLLIDGINAVPAEVMFSSLLTPLELQFDRQFFGEQGQGVVGP